ncbi:restriction endonuclease [Winogradskyella sp. 4-2091]|uniref:restriction endonuclease n=1 Tax=Winogradskyella sp. 4-2091 TaxID=3381659 RepID=UPI003892206D
MTENISTYEEFEKLVSKLSPYDFEKLVTDIFESLDSIESVIGESKIKDRQVDLIATEKGKNIANKPVKWIIEIKKYKSLINIGVIDQFYSKATYLNIPNSKLLLITSSSLTKSAKVFAENREIEVWGLKELAEKITQEIAIRYFTQIVARQLREKTKLETKEDNLISSLGNIKPGKTDWSLYQQTVFDILEYLFCPPLEIPHYELADLDSRNRRDIIFGNDSEDTFWKSIREIYQGHYIVVDAKNYSKKLAKRPIVDITHYLKPYGCGMFGIIDCRMGSGGASDHAIKEQWIGNKKMIVVLSDEDLVEMLQLKKNGNNPVEIIKRKIAIFRMTL